MTEGRTSLSTAGAALMYSASEVMIHKEALYQVYIPLRYRVMRAVQRLQETISTCRFAQRVAMIKNDAVLNEELDPKLMIDKLRREVQQLKDELSLATGEQKTDALDDDDISR